MPKPPDIFDKVRLTPGQLRSVAERRLVDARCLLNSGDSERANGAVYMAGFVIECLLKALLLERHPNLKGRVDAARLSVSDREIFGLLYSHSLDKMIDALPEIEVKLQQVRTRSGLCAWVEFSSICAEWTIHARYSTRTVPLARARSFLETVEEVKKWLTTY